MMRPLLCCSKMAEESQHWKDDCPPPTTPHPWSEEEEHSQQTVTLSKGNLYEQRQKCELRRLLKHTHPELKTLDKVVDEELAEVLKSETGVTAAETGYEGEVLSRRMIFENSALSNRIDVYASKIHTAEGKVEQCDASKASAAFEEHKEKPCKERGSKSVEDNETCTLHSNSEAEEEIRIDVQATRRMFERQSVTNPDNKFKGDVKEVVLKHDSETSGRDKANSEMFSDTERSHKQALSVPVSRLSTDRGLSPREEVPTEEHSTGCFASGGCEDLIKTSADLFKNNPFIPTNIDRENAYAHTSIAQIPSNPSGTAEDCLITNVKNRAHLFDSMPFDRIRQQNTEEIDTMLENIKETLSSLYRSNSIHADGAIIEVNETMIAKKAKFTLSQTGPRIKYEEVAEGGAQNFILQLIPRANLKPHITYLKEDSKGHMEVTALNVPLHHHQFSMSQDTQFRTANMVQLVEDILNQDNSLRKGVIIEEDATNCAEVIVYSLYNYLDEEDVKSYSPRQEDAADYDEPETESDAMRKAENQCIRKGIIKSTIGCFSEMSREQTCPGLMRPEVPVKGNVKLFKSCIEKGDLEYLKVLQAEPTEQDQQVPSDQRLGGEIVHEQRGNQAEDSAAEWVHVDIGKLKSMFSGDQKQTQTKLNVHGGGATLSHGFTGQNVPQEAENGARGDGNSATPMTHEHRGHQVGLVEAIDDNEMSNLQNAINSLQESTVKAKPLLDTSLENQEFLDQVLSDELEVTTVNKRHSDLQQRGDPFTEQMPQLKTQKDTSSEGAPGTEIKNSIKVNDVTLECRESKADSSETASKQDEEEAVVHGKLQAALESLERSNINVTRGDFRAAMIFRNSSKPHGANNVDALCPVTELRAAEVQFSKEVTPTNSVRSQHEMLKKPAASEKKQKLVGPKPAIPPKPDNLKHMSEASEMRHGVVLSQDNQAQEILLIPESDNTKKSSSDQPEAITVTAEDRRPQNLPLQGNVGETDDTHINFHAACEKFKGKMVNPGKDAPVKPKRVKIAQPDILAHVGPNPHRIGALGDNSNTSGQIADGNDKHEKQTEQGSKVEMRGKKGRGETEDERRQRLSVHMDEIMRGNITAAMEIFDNLRKQEELQSILSRVEEIEADTSEVDVRSLRKVYENMPEWVVTSGRTKEQNVEVEQKEDKPPVLKENTENKASVSHVFGDLERASEEIVNLKEQTLARLVDIEEAIKKALYSVSALKCEADIVGLSCLFKESLGAVKESPPSGNISKISIGSSRTKSTQAQGSSTSKGSAALSVGEGAGPEGIVAKQRSSSPSSPAFISIQSTARKVTPAEATACPTCQHGSNSEEIFRTTKTLTRNSPTLSRKRGQKQPKPQVSVLKVQTEGEGGSIVGTRMVTENYERTDSLGNHFYSSKTSTVITAPQETTAASTEAVVSPAVYQITTYPEVRLPINHKP